MEAEKLGNKNVCDIMVGDKIEGFYLLKTSDVKITTSNRRYLDANLSDMTGEINGKYWDLKDDEGDLFKQNNVVKVRGTVISYQNNIQLRIEKIRLSVPEDNVDAGNFVPQAPIKPDEMYRQIKEYSDKINNHDLKMIVDYFLDEYKEKLVYYPAAMKNHHSIRSGLMFHILTMLKVGDGICNVYTFLNRDLLYSGIILHDIEKIDEMNSNNLGIVNEYTIEGNLLGHIIEGIKKIEVVGEKLHARKEEVMLLEHLILTHHYEPEYGSPKKPMIPEGEVLHYIDTMDAALYDMHKALKTTQKGKLSDTIWQLDRRKIYRPDIE